MFWNAPQLKQMQIGNYISERVYLLDGTSFIFMVYTSTEAN